MSKKILLIADLDSVYTKRYAQRVLLPDGWKIVLFPIWGQTGKFDGWYREQGVTICRDTHRLPLIRHIPRLRVWARIQANAKTLESLGPFDAIHNHYLSGRDLRLGWMLKRRFPHARWIASFWGSDLLRATPAQLRQMARPLCACDAVTVITPEHTELIRALYGEACAAKTAVCDFGVDLYDDLDTLRAVANRAACKSHFGLPPEKPLICLGYNVSQPHRHLELLQALGTLPGDVLKGWSVALQMTYGNADSGYLAAVRQAASALPCRSLILTDFMDGPESAYLRLAADAFVLAMPTDAFSSSLQEYLYAGAHVLCGSWLHYPQLDEMGITLIRFQAIAEVPALLRDTLQNPVSAAEQARRAPLRDRYSWNALLEGWRALYRSA